MEGRPPERRNLYFDVVVITDDAGAADAVTHSRHLPAAARLLLA